MNYHQLTIPKVCPRVLQGPGAEQQSREKLFVDGGSIIIRTKLLTNVINPGECENLVVI